jgi:cysteine sulfinate desulfinase/cysteine desulfurase-like protein
MIYLDYAATYPGIKYGVEKINAMNPNANYAFNERDMLQEYEKELKDILKVDSGHILYFRCATEAIEWLINKIKTIQDNMHVGHSKYEHDSCCFGVETDLKDKNSVFNKNLDVYLHQWVNHITGEVFNIESIKNKLPDKCFLLVDATAGFGKVSISYDLEKCADAIFMSGHKIGYPYLSFCWISDRLFDFLGGNKEDVRNQYGLHHGSLSLACINTLVTACKNENAFSNNNQIQWYLHNGYLKTALNSCRINYEIIAPSSRNYFICCLYLQGVDAEALQSWLAEKEIFIGIGNSACSDSHNYRVLKAYDLDDKEAASTIRISFGETTAQDIKDFVEALYEYIKTYVR